MRDLVWSLVRSELGSEGHGSSQSEQQQRSTASAAAPTPAENKAFLQVFQRLSSAPRPRGDPSQSETEVNDLIATTLARQRSRGSGPGAASDGGEGRSSGQADAQLRFNSLRQRMQEQPVLKDTRLRSSTLELLYALRGEGGGGSDELRSTGAASSARSRPPLGTRRPSWTRAAGGPGLEPFEGGGGGGGAPSQSSGAAPGGGKPTPKHMVMDKLGHLHAKPVGSSLGFHIVAGGVSPPAMLTEETLLRSLLHALQGVNSACFRYNEEKRCFVVDPSYILSRPAWHLVRHILTLGDLHKRLLASTNSTLEADSGKSLLQQALSESLRDQLREYYKVLALLIAKLPQEADEKDASTGGLTLRRLWTCLMGPLERMRVLVTLAEACVPLRGGALASTVHGCSRVGDALAQESCDTILRRVVAPLLAMMRAWMSEGELHDPYGEFFVCADASVPLEDLWTHMYCLDVEMVPSFLSLPLARKILLTGKSVNFIRLCCQGDATNSTQTAGGGTFAGPFEHRQSEDLQGFQMDADGKEFRFADLSAVVEQAASRTNKRLVSMMMERFALMDHCKALRSFMLLGQGDFVECLLDIAEEDLSRKASDIYRHQLQGLLDMSVRQTNAQFCPPDVLARLGVKLLRPSEGEKGWDVFLLDYAINSPLHVVFTPEAMKQYDRAFAFLWRLRRVSHGLAKSWSEQTALQRQLASCGRRLSHRAPELRLEMRQTLHKCACLRNEIHHLVQNIQSYVMCEVLETSWSKLQRGWNNSIDLDEVIAEHQRYLTSIEDSSFLSPKAEEVLSHLSEILRLSLEFCETHEQVCSSVSDAVEAIVSEPDAPVPFARSLAEARAKIDKLGASFSAQLQKLLPALEAQPVEQHNSDLRFLTCRLNFNDYYYKNLK